MDNYITTFRFKDGSLVHQFDTSELASRREREEPLNIKSAWWRIQLAATITGKILTKYDFNLDDIVVSIPRKDIKYWDEKDEEFKIIRLYHSSVTFNHDDSPHMWNVRIFRDITLGIRFMGKDKPPPALAWIQKGIETHIPDDHMAPRIAVTYINIANALAPMIYCKIEGLNPYRFSAAMFRASNEKAHKEMTYKICDDCWPIITKIIYQGG